MDLVATLSQNYMFQDVPHDVLEDLAGKAVIKDFLGGDQLVRQFDRSQDVFVILDGQALSRTFSGEVVARFGPGSIVGEVALIDGEPRSTNVVAVHGCKAAILPATAIKGVMESDPRVGYLIVSNLAKVLCKRIRQMNEQVDSLPAPPKR